MSSIGTRSLLVSCQSHQCGVLFFIAVELDGTAVVAHFGKREANHSLFFLRNGAALLLCLVVDFGAEACHYFVSGTAQVSRPPVVVDARYAPGKAFLAVGSEERAGLCACYHGRICHDITLPCVLCEHLVCRVPQAFVCSFAVRSAAMSGCLIGCILRGS